MDINISELLNIKLDLPLQNAKVSHQGPIQVCIPWRLRLLVANMEQESTGSPDQLGL